MTNEKIVLMKLIEILENPVEARAYGVIPGTAKRLIELIRDMMANDGKLLKGRRTLDGVVMSMCPKHDYAPMYMCMQCEFFNGKDIFHGVCVAQDNRYPTEPKYAYEIAARLENEYRQENGTPERGKTITVDEINERKEEADKKKEDDKKDEKESIYASQTKGN